MSWAEWSNLLLAAAIRSRTAGAPRSRTRMSPPPFRPVLALQSRTADCGYICVSALCGVFGVEADLSSIKSRASGGIRGATLRQVRDVLRDWEFGAEAVSHRKKPDDLPCPGIVLLEGGHYIVVIARRGAIFECYYPEYGWQHTAWSELADRVTGYGVTVTPPASPSRARNRAPWSPRTLQAMLRVIAAELRARRTRRRALMVLAIAAISQGLTLSAPIFSMKLIDRVDVGQTAGLFERLGLGLVAISVLSAMAGLVSTLLSNTLVNDVTTRAAKRAFNSLTYKDDGWFDDISHRAIFTALASGDRVIQTFAELLSLLGGVAINLVVGAMALLFFSPWLVVPGLVLTAVRFTLDRLFDHRQSASYSAAFAKANIRDSFALEVTARAPMVARQGDARRGALHYMRLVRDATHALGQAQRLQASKSTILAALGVVETLCFLAIGAVLMKSGVYTVGGFVAAGVYKDLLSRSLDGLSGGLTRLKLAEMHALQSREIMEDQARIGPSRRMCKGRAEFRDVCFRYPGATADTLRGVNLTIEPGQVVALIGASGSGKSTLARIIAAGRRPDRGAILIDGEPPAYPMSGLASVLQGDVLISASVRDNICLMRKNVSDDDILRALDLAQAREFVMAMPMGLDTKIGEAVGGLSGGQKQRLLIARAILGGPRLVVMDEATSALDLATEERVLSNLRASGASLLLISHRPEAWMQADVVYSLDHGELSRVSPPLMESSAGKEDGIRLAMG